MHEKTTEIILYADRKELKMLADIYWINGIPIDSNTFFKYLQNNKYQTDDEERTKVTKKEQEKQQKKTME